MSRLDNIDALEKQLAELQMTMEINTPKVKKIPPAVPPKKKAQPQVPHSTYVNKVREPSFSTKISPTSNISSTNNTTYSNIHHVSNNPIQKEYANLGQIKQVPAYYNDNVHPQNMSVPSKNYNPTYSNIAPYHNNDELPLPPPPPPPLPAANSYTYNHDHEEYLPPPSPVSSNYSELVRATTNLNYNQDQPAYPPIYQNEFNDYSSHNAPVFESLYEPISPRPNNNFTPTKSGIVENYRTQSPNMNKSPLPKEEEVDALTNLLVQSISESQDLDVFGTCVKCQGKVIGESSGCTAMGNVYHIECFCCSRCKVNLQGKPFYAVEGNPYCEIDYYETLEKCSVCYKPILNRIIRATGKPYHPTCFSCVVCGKSLDGIPFTVDAMNQIHCIEDFHKKFAPRCCVCQLPIMPEEGQDETVRVVALDRSFHVRCYRCEDCGLHLSSEAEGRGCYPLDGHILCQQCNGHRIRLLTNVMTTDL